MATIAEVKGILPRVLELTVPVQKLRSIETTRVTSLDCLDRPFVHSQVSPNQVAEAQVAGHKWALIVPYGGYTPREHLMAMRFEEDYVPGPERLDPTEGDDLFLLMGQIAKIMTEDHSVSTVVFGWNWSPRSFGQRGYQSIPTMFHPSIFCLPKESGSYEEYIRSVGLNTLNRDEIRAVKGGRYNLLFGNLLTEHVLNGNFQGDKEMRDRVLTIDEVQIGERATVVPIKGTLDEILTTPGIFRGVFQPMGRFIDRTAVLLSTTLTDFCPQDADRIIEEALNKDATVADRKSALANLTRTPNLLPRDQRQENISYLEEDSYPYSVVESLRKMSNRLPDNTRPLIGWKVGFGCAVAIIYHTDSQTGVLSISSAIADGPGGIVESGLGAVLRRPAYPFSEEEMAARRDRYFELVDSLPSVITLAA